MNFINLAIAQALRRSKEVGIRKVLGSLRGQLFRQFVAETAVITIIATIVAIGLAYLVLPYVNTSFKTQMTIHLFTDIQLMLLFRLLILVVTFAGGIISGSYLITLSTGNSIKRKIVPPEYRRLQYPSCFNCFPVYHFIDSYHRDDRYHTANVICETI